MCVLFCSLCTKPWGIAMVRVWTPINNWFFVCYSLLVLLYMFPWLSELDILRTGPLGRSLKSWDTKFGPDPFLLGQKLGWRWRGVVMTSGSQPFTSFSVGIFLICQMYRSCPASLWISLKGNFFTCSCTFKCVSGRRGVRESSMLPSWFTPYICAPLTVDLTNS